MAGDDTGTTGLVGAVDGLLTGLAAPSVELFANQVVSLEGVRVELVSVTGVVRVQVDSLGDARRVVREERGRSGGSTKC